MVNETVEADEESFDEVYAQVRSMQWPSQCNLLFVLLLGALEEPLVAPREPEGEELLRRLQAEGFFERLESVCKLKFTRPWRKNLCLTIQSLKCMAPWDANDRDKSLKAVLRRADECDRMADQLEEQVEFLALARGPYLPDEFCDVVRLPTLLRQWTRLVRETIGTNVGKSKKLTGAIALEYLTASFEAAGGQAAGSWSDASRLDGPFMQFLMGVAEILPTEIRGETPKAFALRWLRIRYKNAD